jgi:hypothetical protein
MANVVNRLHDILNYVGQYLKLARDRKKNTLRQTGQLGGGHTMALSPKLQEEEMAQTSLLLGGTLPGSDTEKGCGVRNPMEPWIEEGGGTFGPTGSFLENCSGRTALIGEQCDIPMLGNEC